MAVETASNLFEELSWRGLVKEFTEGADDVLRSGRKITGYIGFDPTADSLHVGSLVPIMVLVHIQRHGHTPIVLVGGGTGMIGDPSGKTRERQLLDLESLDRNIIGIRDQLSRFVQFEGVDNPALLVNNADWLTKLGLIDFLRDTGKYFTVNYMIAKDSVKKRLESDDGLSFTEFSYMLLQSHDFLHMFRELGCSFQFGGSDQWGNITAGVTLIRRLDEGEAFGLTMPLVTTSSGVKFGKSEAGNVWLDINRTSAFRFYQFWLNTADEDVIQYLKFFTLLSPAEVAALEQAMKEAPHERAAQKKLAADVTRFVHGEAALAQALRATGVLFSGDISGMSADELLDIFSEVPSSNISLAEMSGEGQSIIDLIVVSGLERSRKMARTLIESGGCYMNGARMDEMDLMVTASDAIDGKVIVLRKGKKQYHLVRIEV